MRIVRSHELLDVRASMGYAVDYRQTPQKAQSPPYFYKILKDMFLNDPVLSTAIDITVDAVTYNSFDFIKKDPKTSDERVIEARKRFFEELDFDQVLDPIVYSLILYGESYIEMVGDPIEEVYNLESTEMRINFGEHGEVIDYVQMVEGRPPEKYPRFPKEKVIRIPLKLIGSEVYSYSPFDSISRSYATKIYANNYLQGIFTNLPPKLVHFLKNASPTQWDRFNQNLLKCKVNPKQDLTVSADGYDAKVLKVDFEDGFMKVLQYLREEILMVTRVPPILVGIPDNSNRSNSEAQFSSFEMKCRKIQQKIESYMNKTFMEKAGFGDLKFKFNPITLKSVKSVVEIANTLNSFGLESEIENPVVYYLKNEGFPMPPDVRKPSAEELQKREIDNQNLWVNKLQPPTNEKNFPSRKRNDANDSIKSERDMVGSSEAGGKKLEKMQTRSTAIDEYKEKFNNYPYVIDD